MLVYPSSFPVSPNCQSLLARLGFPHLHGYQVVISRGFKCELNLIKVTLLKLSSLSITTHFRETNRTPHRRTGFLIPHPT